VCFSWSLQVFFILAQEAIFHCQTAKAYDSLMETLASLSLQIHMLLYLSFFLLALKSYNLPLSFSSCKYEICQVVEREFWLFYMLGP